MFTITTSAASGTPATLAKAMAKQVTPQRLLTAMMDTTSMWASLTLPEGVTVRGTLGSTSLFAEPASPVLLEAQVARARQVAAEAGNPADVEPVYTSNLPLRRIRWEKTWQVHPADGPTLEYSLVVWLESVDGTRRFTMTGWLDQRPLGTDLPDTALAPRFRRGQINWQAGTEAAA